MIAIEFAMCLAQLPYPADSKDSCVRSLMESVKSENREDHTCT
jgi:hypothetical protein